MTIGRRRRRPDLHTDWFGRVSGVFGETRRNGNIITSIQVQRFDADAAETADQADSSSRRELSARSHKAIAVISTGECNTLALSPEDAAMRKRWRGLSPAQLEEMWRRRKQGWTFAAIGAAVERPLRTVYGVVAGHGGIAPRARRRARWALSLA